MKPVLYTLLLCSGLAMLSCKKTNTSLDNTCPYTLYSPSGGGCGPGTVQASGSLCCPQDKPFACNGICYATCEEAYAGCGGSVIKGQASPPGNIQLNGTWKRNTLSDPCEELTVSFDGSEGRVTAAPGSCCYSPNDLVWKNYSADYIYVKDCASSFNSSLVVFNGENQVSIGGIPYLRQ